MRLLLYALGLILGLVGLLAGGCSLALSPIVLPDIGHGLADIAIFLWLGGFLVAAAGIWAAVALIGAGRRRAPRPGSEV